MPTKYINELYFEGVTYDEIASNSCRHITGDCVPQYDFDPQELVEQAELSIPDAIHQEFQKIAREHGANITVTGITYPHAELYERTVHRQFRDYTEKRKYARLWIHCKVQFESDKSIIGSPIAPALLIALKYVLSAVVVIVLGFFVIEAMKSWLQSMSTRVWEVVEIVETYDEEGNLIDRTTKKESGTAPDPLGMGMIGIFLLILAVLFMVFYVGMPKRKR